MTGELIYLASPFTTDDATEKRWRFEQVCKAAGKLMKEGKIVFSPIAHGWPIAEQCELPTDWEYWKENCTAFVTRCQSMCVLDLPGWAESTGVQAEIDIAEDMCIPICMMNHVTGLCYPYVSVRERD
jgi:hypothetical protein